MVKPTPSKGPTWEINNRLDGQEISSHSWNPKVKLRWSEDAANVSCSELDESNPHIYSITLLCENLFSYFFPIYNLSLPSDLPCSGFSSQIFCAPSTCAKCATLLNHFDYFAKITNYEFPWRIYEY